MFDFPLKLDYCARKHVSEMIICLKVRKKHQRGRKRLKIQELRENID